MIHKIIKLERNNVNDKISMSSLTKKNKAICGIITIIILTGAVFAYQKGNSSIGIKEDKDATSKNLAIKSAGMDDTRTDNFLSTNIAAADETGNTAGENDTNKKNNSLEIEKWISALIGFEKIEARILNVPADYQKIQDAINNANRGDVVKVLGGEYKENIIMKNGVSLEGEGAEMAIIDGNNLGNAITFKNVRDPRTYLSGFTIKNAGKSLSGVSIENSSPWIHDNLITENEFGIYVKGESRPVIQKNVINNSSKGIQAYNFFEEKTGEDSAGEKQEKEAGKESKTASSLAQGAEGIDSEASKTDPIIIDNLITDNKIGIDLNNSHADIEHNNISYNNHYKTYLGATYGINISRSSSVISSNIITDNGICELCAGINADEGSKSVMISYNNIWNNRSDFLCFGECILEENNISEDPLYADTMLGDYKLQAESTMIGKAKDGLDIGIRW